MKRWLVLCALAFGLSACGSIKVRDVNQEEMKNVQKVAVASFSFTQPHSTLTSNQVNIGEDNDEAEASLKDIAGTLAKTMKWKMLPLDEMRGNAAYQATYEKKMKGWQMGKVPGNARLLIAKGVMDAQSLIRMKPPERDQLMSALGVDAMMEVAVNVVFANKGVAIAGIGDRYPQAYINLWMYKRGVEKPVWFDGRVVGDASSSSVGKTGFFNELEVTRLGRQSAQNAFSKIKIQVQ